MVGWKGSSGGVVSQSSGLVRALDKLAGGGWLRFFFSKISYRAFSVLLNWCVEVRYGFDELQPVLIQHSSYCSRENNELAIV